MEVKTGKTKRNTITWAEKFKGFIPGVLFKNAKNPPKGEEGKKNMKKAKTLKIESIELDNSISFVDAGSVAVEAMKECSNQKYYNDYMNILAAKDVTVWVFLDKARGLAFDYFHAAHPETIAPAIYMNILDDISEGMISLGKGFEAIGCGNRVNGENMEYYALYILGIAAKWSRLLDMPAENIKTALLSTK